MKPENMNDDVTSTLMDAFYQFDSNDSLQYGMQMGKIAFNLCKYDSALKMILALGSMISILSLSYLF